MFQQLANNVAGGAATVFQYHPRTLSRWMEEAWSAIRLPAPLPVPAPGTSADILGDPAITTAIALPPPPPASGIAYPAPGAGFVWNNLIYAYVIESTGVVEVMTEVLRRNAIGETLDAPTIAAQQWLRSTEELFYRDPPAFQSLGVGSHIRRYGRESRRGAYWRMFGLDLPFPIPGRWADPIGGQSWKTDVGAGVNTGFRRQWTELLRQVWLGIENRRNLIGANATDAEYVRLLSVALGDMLRMRRRGGQLAREEAAYVALMSWFDLTLSDNTAIVAALNADATTPEERLARIAQRVGMTPTPRSRELFQLGQPASDVIRMIELRAFDTAAGAGALFPIVASPLSDLVNRVIDLWQSATGDMIKEPRVTVSSISGTSQPARIPTPMEPARSAPMATPPQPVGAAGNGRTR